MITEEEMYPDDMDEEEFYIGDMEGYFPLDWEEYKQTVDFDSGLPGQIRDCLKLEARRHEELYAFIQNEYPEYVGYALSDLFFDSTVRDVVDYVPPLIHCCLKWMVATEDKDCRKEIADVIHIIVSGYLDMSKDLTESGIRFLEKSKKGSDRKSGKSQKKHWEVLSKAKTLREANPRLSKHSIANRLINRGETDYRKSSLLRILRDLDEFLV